MYRTSNILEDLHNGDTMSQEVFHALYEGRHNEFRAELIDGMVYVREPLSETHAEVHARVISIFDAYRASTTGVQAFSDATVILSETDEVQPDAMLRIRPEYNGQTSDYWFRKGRRTRGPYVKGAPELVAEVAFSSRAIDLHAKQKRYQNAGVLEYLVISLKEQKLFWFDLSHAQELNPNESGIFQSRVFPGLWIHESALLSMDYKLTMETLNKGLGSEEHKSFLRALQNRKYLKF